MIRVAICNRDLKMVKQMEKWIVEEGDLEKRNVKSYCYRKGEDLLWDVEEQGGFDIAILELIEAKDIETTKRISVVNPYCQIIFLAESDKLAYDAYLAHPFSFILMPVEQEQLIGIYKEACYKTGKHERLFCFHSHYVYYQIPVNHIMIFESEKRQIRMICQQILSFDEEIDIIVLARKKYFDYSFKENLEQFNELMKKIKIRRK